MKISPKKNIFWAILPVIFFITGSLVFAGIVLDNYRVDHGESIVETAVDTLDYLIENNSLAKDYFIPNKTLAEWTAFKNAADTYLTDIDVTRVWSGLRIVATNAKTTGDLLQHGSTWWEGANNFCETDTATDDDSEWKALVWSWDSTTGASVLPQMVIYDDERYVNAQNNLLFVASDDNLVPNTITNPVNSAFTGPLNGSVWTGKSSVINKDCQWSNGPWSTTRSTSYGYKGVANYMDSGWIAQGQLQCNSTSGRIFCVEQPKTIPEDMPNINVNPLSYDFGGRSVGIGRTTTIVVQNQGFVDLTVNLALTGDSNFSLDTPTSFTVNPSNTENIIVRFLPTVEGATYAGTLQVSSNDPDESNIQVSLAGSGLPPFVCTYTNPVVTWLNPLTPRPDWSMTGTMNEESVYINYYWGGNIYPNYVRGNSNLPAGTASYTYNFSCMLFPEASFYIHPEQGGSHDDCPAPLVNFYTGMQTSSFMTDAYVSNLSLEWVDSGHVNLHWNNDFSNQYFFHQVLVDGNPVGSYLNHPTLSASQVENNIPLSQGVAHNIGVQLIYDTQGLISCYYRDIDVMYEGAVETISYTHYAPKKKIVATNATHNGNFEGISGNTWYADADAFCQSDSATGAGTWKALMWSTPSATLRPGSVTSANTVYVNNDNIVIFNSPSNNYIANVALSPIDPEIAGSVWTGKGSNLNCIDWSAAFNINTGMTGKRNLADTSWLNSNSLSCISGARIYCVEQ